MINKFLLTAGCGFLFSLSITCAKINDIATDLMISDEDEVKLGTQYKDRIEADTAEYPLYTAKTNYHQNLVNYIDSIGRNIVNHQDDRTGIDFSFKIINNDSVVNAFAVPGGFVYVYTGLIINARNEAEIAGVLAHEISHVAKRHGAKQMVKQYGIGMLLDVVVGDSSAIRTVIDLSSGLLFLKYGRDNEFEADSCAVEYLIASGYNPSGMKTFLETLASLGNASPKLLEFMSTHPNTTDRIAAVDKLIEGTSSEVRNRAIPELKYAP
ncbi:MAG: M48 family metalloprotease [Chitinispirillaceae bacterium]|nr:M48 family metalloprotease [Chitinispirillaceae bacterium]